MNRSEIPDLYIEMLAAGELDEKKRIELERTFGAEELQRRVEALKLSDTEILDQYPAERMAAGIHTRAEAPRGRTETARERIRRARPAWWEAYRERFRSFALRVVTQGLAVRITAGIAAAGLVVVFGVFIMVRMDVPGSNQGIRAKGIHPTLLIYRHDANEAQLLQNGDIVKAGDTLQISYVSAGKKYGVILSVDGRDTVTVHLPESYRPGEAQTRQAPALEPQGQTALPFAYQLDNAPRFERFFFVTSDSRFPVSEVVKAADKLAGSGDAFSASKLALPSGLDQITVLLKKPGE